MCNIITRDNLGEIVDSIYITFLILVSSKKIDKRLIKKETFIDMWDLVLPLKENKTEIYMYYIITDNWKERIWNITTKKSFYAFSRTNKYSY